VTPPDGELDPQSRLTPSARGKAPGRKGPNGWTGYNWNNGRPSREDVGDLIRDGANVGVRAGRTPGLDIDVDHPALADLISQEAQRFLGRAPVRLSRKPRRLLVYRADEPFGKLWCEIEYAGQAHKVELLADGQQYVVHGAHPSGTEYGWEGRALWGWAPEDLEPVTAERVQEFFQHIASKLGNWATVRIRGGSSSTPTPPQEELRASSVDWVREAVRKIPNGERFASRDEWIKLAHAIKAAVGPENVEEGHRIFQEFSARWEDGANEPDYVEDQFRKIAPAEGYRVGWTYLAELAGENLAAEVFEADTAAAPPAVEPRSENRVASFAVPYEEIEYTGPPGFLLRNAVLEHDINFVCGDGGSWKTTAVLAIAAAVASGSSIFGHDNPHPPAKVLYVSEEDDANQIRNKLDAIVAGSSMEVPPGFLQVMAQRGFSFGSQAWRDDLRSYVRGEGFGLVVFDPLVEMQEGKENSNDDARPVLKFLRSITARGGPAVLVIHHAGKASKDKSKIDRFMRGASAFKNGARSILAFSKTADGFLMDSLKLSRAPEPEPTAVRVEIETDPEDEHGIRWKRATFEGAPRWKVEREAAEEAIRTALLEAGTLNSTDLREHVSAAGHARPAISQAIKSLQAQAAITYDRGEHNAKMWRLVAPGEEFASPPTLSDLTESST
jgi:hypothetical protein